LVFALMTFAACSDDSAVDIVTEPNATSPALAAPATVPGTTTGVDSTASIEKFGAAIKTFTVEVDLKSSDIGFLIDTASFFATGKLVSAQPGPVRIGATTKLACEVAPGTTVAGDCSRAAQNRGVVLRFELDERRQLHSAKASAPLNAMVDVEFPNGAYSVESNQREVDKAIAEVIGLAPLGTRFALFFGPSNYGTTYQIAGSASWGWIDSTQHVQALPTAREEPWIDGSSTVPSILAQIEMATR
jgi:hypothetical protein